MSYIKKVHRFAATIKDGKLKLEDKDSFNDTLKEYDGDVWLQLENYPTTRSPHQNAYYRTIIRRAATELGYIEDEFHLIVKQHFKISSTADLSKEEFSYFLDKLKHWLRVDAGINVNESRTREK